MKMGVLLFSYFLCLVTHEKIILKGGGWVLRKEVRYLIYFLLLWGWNFIEALSPPQCHYEKVEEVFFRGQKKIANIVLANGMQVLLISDPYASESAGAVSIEAGAWDDPKKFPGMAHFVEHLLFLGTSAYPKEEEFMRYVQERGGECNASTTRDRTVYGFSVHTEAFSESLNRFSHFFIDPLFTPSAIKREMHAVHHEFEDGIENDFFRIWRVFKETGNSEHPNKNFSCGNLTSLKEIQGSDIEQWFEKHYVPCHMKLVLSSSLQLEQLIELACRFFSCIPERGASKTVKKKSIEDCMVSSLQKGAFFYMEPTFNNKILSLRWEVPKEFMKNKRKRALTLLEKAINRNHPNSLSKVLEDEGLARQVKAEFWKIEKEHGFFNLDVTLTQEGVEQYEKVVTRCFQAIHSFKEGEIPEHLLSQLKPSKLESFVSKDFRGVMEIASDFIEEFYLDSVKSESLDLIAIASAFLEELTPQNCVYFLVAPFQELGIFPTHLEKWMGAEYFIRKMTEEKIKIWGKADSDPLIGFKSKEELQQESLFLADLEEDSVLTTVRDPVFIVNTPFVKIRLVEPLMESDKLEAFFFIDAPSIGGSIKNLSSGEIFIRSINNILKEEFKGNPEVRCELEIDGRNLCLFFTASESFVKESLQKVFFLMRNPSTSVEQFEKAKKSFLDHYVGDPDPIEHAQKILETLVSRLQSTEMELYHSVIGLSYEEYKKWQKNALDRLSIEGAFLGMLQPLEAKELWDSISLVFPFIPYKSYELMTKTCVYLEDQQAHCFVQKTHRLGNALLLMVASQGEYNKNSMARQMISSLLQNEFFSELRTRQQTGYKIHNWARVVNNTICYGFSLQSSTYHPIDLLKRVEYFLNDFTDALEERFSLSRFELLQDTLMIFWRRQKGQASKQEDRVFADRNLEMIKKLSYEKVLRNIRETFSIKNRKRVAVLVEGREFSFSDREELSSIQYEIIDECG